MEHPVYIIETSTNVRLCERLWQTQHSNPWPVIMSSLLLVVLICFIAWYWVKNARIQRERWLNRLSLPGIWVCRLSDKVTTRLEFTGDNHQGRYVEQDGDDVIEGSWHLDGHTLTLERVAGGFPLELSLFKEGKIGLYRPEGTQRIYIKKQANDNVVEMRFKK
jgi:hypothetical protein